MEKVKSRVKLRGRQCGAIVEVDGGAEIKR